MKKQGIIIILIILILVVAAFTFIKLNGTTFENKTENNNQQIVEQYKDLQTNDDYINAIDDTLNYIK